jgi:hypothetical protein
MEKRRAIFSLGLIAVAAIFWLLPSVGQAVPVDCDAGDKIQGAIDANPTGSTISVSGTCNENVIIREGKDRITLDGGGKAIINGPDATVATVRVRGRGITITNFNSAGMITGGQDGIQVQRGGTATIDTNLVTNTGRYGIGVIENSFATIINNIIEDNPIYGILVNENSDARIGFVSFDDVLASPNTIQNNGGSGILVVRSSSAGIVGNTINGNKEDGVRVARGSHADISDNIINANVQNGILVTHNSGVNLGSDTGTTIFDLPNNTAPVPPLSNRNGNRGINCSIGAYVDGRRGGLKGVHGVILAGTGCTNSTIP